MKTLPAWAQPRPDDEAPAHAAAEAWLRTALGRATLRSDDMRLALHRAFRCGYATAAAAMRSD